MLKEILICCLVIISFILSFIGIGLNNIILFVVFSILFFIFMFLHICFSVPKQEIMEFKDGKWKIKKEIKDKGK
jgi:hypothetical protein